MYVGAFGAQVIENLEEQATREPTSAPAPLPETNKKRMRKSQHATASMQTHEHKISSRIPVRGRQKASFNMAHCALLVFGVSFWASPISIWKDVAKRQQHNEQSINEPINQSENKEGRARAAHVHVHAPSQKRCHGCPIHRVEEHLHTHTHTHTPWPPETPCP